MDTPPCTYWYNWNGYWDSWPYAGDPMVDIWGTVGAQALCDPYHTYDWPPYPWETEPNDDHTVADQISCVEQNEFGPICGEIIPEDDEDWYVFGVAERTRVRIDVYAHDTPYFFPYLKGLDSKVELYDAGLTLIAVNDDNSGPPGPWNFDSNIGGLWWFGEPPVALDPGTYYIRVLRCPYVVTTGPYFVALCCYPCLEKASLGLHHPNVVIQNVPFGVTVTPLDALGGTACAGGPWWFDVSSTDPCVRLPQGDLLLHPGPRTFEVIAPCPTNDLIIEVEEVKEWDPERIIYAFTDPIVVLPAEIDQPDALTVSDLPSDQGGYVVAEFDYSDNHPGLAQYNVVDYYQFYRRLYPIVYYDDPGHPAGAAFAFPHMTRGTPYSGWGTSPEKTVALDGSYIAFRYTGLNPATPYRARATIFQAGAVVRKEYVKVGSSVLVAHGQPDSSITPTTTPTTYVFDIPAAEIVGDKLYLYIHKASGPNALVSEVWIEEDAPQWYQYGTVAASSVPDAVGMLRVIMPDYGFPGHTSDYYVQAESDLSAKGVGEAGGFVLNVCKAVGEVSESAMCGPAFGRSLDNMPPADPTNITVVGSEISWSLSYDDRLLQTGRDWLGNEWDMYGVTNYVIFRNGDYAGTVDRGVSSWTDARGSGGQYRVYAFDGTNLSKGTARVTVVPTAYALSENYPNPFNPETHISFALPENSWVELVIYNVLGERVRSLVGQDMEAGYHRVVWDGKDSRGVSVSSGVYFYCLSAGEFAASKKMLLLK